MQLQTDWEPAEVPQGWRMSCLHRTVISIFLHRLPEMVATSLQSIRNQQPVLTCMFSLPQVHLSYSGCKGERTRLPPSGAGLAATLSDLSLPSFQLSSLLRLRSKGNVAVAKIKSWRVDSQTRPNRSKSSRGDVSNVCFV